MVHCTEFICNKYPGITYNTQSLSYVLRLYSQWIPLWIQSHCIAVISRKECIGIIMRFQPQHCNILWISVMLLSIWYSNIISHQYCHSNKWVSTHSYRHSFLYEKDTKRMGCEFIQTRRKYLFFVLLFITITIYIILLL